MEFNLDTLLHKDELTKDEIIYILKLSDEKEIKKLYDRAYEVKSEYVGTKVYYRGLIEYSNLCSKDCYYCGIRVSNDKYSRYTMSDDEVIEAAKSAFEYGYGSVVIQSGEVASPAFVERITHLLKEIKKIGDGKLGITLSVGEFDKEDYQKFYEAGAHRFLLRIESSNRELYSKIHPPSHKFEDRIAALKSLQDIGYQTGTGIMIGLPGQTYEDLANDLLFFKEFDIDMVGMGPFIEAENTPMYDDKGITLTKMERFNLTLRMIALLRIIMKDINIASATALQAIVPNGRELGLKAGSNVIMPNLTPVKYRADYQLYDEKPCIDEEASKCRHCLDARVKSAGDSIGYNEWGDSPHYRKRRSNG